jgi:hypothetical protein
VCYRDASSDKNATASIASLASKAYDRCTIGYPQQRCRRIASLACGFPSILDHSSCAQPVHNLKRVDYARIAGHTAPQWHNGCSDADE